MTLRFLVISTLSRKTCIIGIPPTLISIAEVVLVSNTFLSIAKTSLNSDKNIYASSLTVVASL